MDLTRTFADRSCFVTGADGFLGSHLTEALVEAGADVHVFVRATSSGELRNIGHLRGRMTVHRGNLTDEHSIRLALKRVKKAQRDKLTVFHLGAQAHVGESWERPIETLEANTLGTAYLLQSLVDLDLDIFKVDTAGTSEEYGNPRDGHHVERDESGEPILHERSPTNPQSIYATAKLAADFLTMNYYDAYGLPGVVTRMFNNYGPRQNPRYVTGTIITQALARKEVVLGNLAPKRDFCFVTDGVRGHCHVAAKGRPGEVYCYGYGKNITMQQWADLILAVGEKGGFWKDRTLVTTKDRFRPGASDVMELKVGYRKLNELTGWTPLVHWEEGIARTIEWYAKNRDAWIGRVDW